MSDTTAIAVRPDPMVAKELEKKELGILDQAKTLRVNSKPAYEKAATLRLVVKGLLKEINDTFKPMQVAADNVKKEIMAQRRKHETPLLTAEKMLTGKATAWYREEEKKAREKEDAARKKKEDEAEALRKQGLEEEAEILETAPVQSAPNRVKGSAGSYYTSVWTAEIVDVDEIPRQYMIPDMQALSKLAKANKGKNPPAGVRFVDKGGIRQR